MGRRKTRNVSSTTTTLPATSVTIPPESPQVKAFMRSAMERLGLTEQEVRKRAIKLYGSVERTMRATEIGEAENKAAIEAYRNSHAEIIQVGRKPKAGEEVTFAKLRDDLMIRVWGGDLASYELQCFDFVNDKREYILTPDDVKIYTVATAFSPSAQVLSMEDSLEKAKATSIYSHATRPDSNWETYIVREGTVLRITQKDHPDRFLNVPMRVPHGSTLVLQPW